MAQKKELKIQSSFRIDIEEEWGFKPKDFWL